MISSKTLSRWPTFKETGKQNDQLLQQDGYVFAGRHMLFDCWNASNLDDLVIVEQALRNAAQAMEQEVLHIHLHDFLFSGKVIGVAITPNSHINIKTWPKMGYAALDFFVDGKVNTNSALTVFKHAFLTDNLNASEHLRGRQFTDLTPATSD